MAEWDTAFINDLPDAAFAAIESGGTKDDEGKTTPRSLRHLPHHNASVKDGDDNGSVDKPHLRDALSRVSQSDLSQSLEDKAQAHLDRHAKALGIGDPDGDSDKKSRPTTFERRIFGECRMEVREGTGGAPKIVGYGALFNSPTEISDFFGSFREQIAPGAFTKTLREADIRALFNHDPNVVLGRNKAGTLALNEDARGLHYEITPPDTQAARDLTESIRRGDVSQSSFAFQVMRQEWKAGAKGEPDERTLLEVKLFDVSPVTFPAYPDTESGLRAFLPAGLTPEDITGVRRALRGAPLTSADREAIRRTLDVLRSFLPAAPASDGHPAGARSDTAPARMSHPVALLRRRLELEALTLS